MELVLQNVHASAPLRLHVDLECNTPKDRILSNVLANSKDAKRMWVKQRAAHSRVAVLVGNGPSLLDTMDEIRELVQESADVFALNGACIVLNKRQVEVDYQVIMDAQPGTRTLVGRAGCHLFASQVDPTLFVLRPSAVLWHATYGETLVDEQEGFDSAGRDYCLIGAAASVGATALPLLYAMGYRQVKVFGMDSSNRGEVTHARPQKINDGDVYTVTTFHGKEYTSSLTMKLQAEAFCKRGRELERLGMVIQVFGTGLLPDMWNTKMTELEKYTEIWHRPEYRVCSPGERAAKEFVELCDVRASSHVVDFGCGSGRGGNAVHDLTGCKVTLIDFVDAVEADNELPLVLMDVSVPLSCGVRSDFIYCTDVMEHIPPERVAQTIRNALAIAPIAFFQISLIPDSMGELIGQELHLTVRPCEWWLEEFQGLGFKVPHYHDKGDIAQYVVTR